VSLSARTLGLLILLVGGALGGCDDAVSQGVETTPLYAVAVETFTPGEGAGFGQEDFPQIVLGQPQGKGPSAGGTDVVSLGVGGEIVLSFGSARIADGPGPDFAVYENAFYIGGDPNKVFSELAEVSVSQDGETWLPYACDSSLEGPIWPGCAGGTPTIPCTEETGSPHGVECGGDLFDLADLGLESVRYVRIRDLSTSGTAPSAGFDLDAVGLLHWRSD
jgi:hypothetical protein